MRPILAAAAALALPAAAGAQAADPVAACAARLVPYAERPSIADPEFSLALDAPGGGRLVYVGARHSRDPAEAQFAEIEAEYRRAAPTVVFYEGPSRPVGASGEETIRAYGESGFVRFLAGRSGARVDRLEPPPQVEMAALLERFPAEQIQLFFVLRETSRLREREGLASEALDAAVATLLERAAPLFVQAGGAAWTLDDLAAAHRRHWSDPADWRDVPGRWFDPLASAEETGGLFTHDVNRASSEARNRHMYAALAAAALRGERVFAVVGRDHVPAQAAALRCALASGAGGDG